MVEMTMFKLGKQPARANAFKLRLSNYLDRSKLPVPPTAFGHYSLVKDWGMLGNDIVGDCVLAGAAHETMLWTTEAKRATEFTPQSVLADYSAITGYDSSDASTDQGTDMQVAAKYRQKMGLLDAHGVRHKVGAYVSIETGNVDDMKLATYLFGAIGVGIILRHSNMDQFAKGEKWTYDYNSPEIGGHYVPMFGWSDDDNFFVCTWGVVHLCSHKFLVRQCDEVVAYLSMERLVGNKSIDGFDFESLEADMKLLQS
jgi:hypothetical protein